VGQDPAWVVALGSEASEVEFKYLMYGAETWALSKVDESRLGVYERKILRRIYAPICEEVVWRSRYNEELYCLYDEADLVTTIKITRLNGQDM